MAKKLSVVQLKQQKAVLAAVTALEEKAMPVLAGLVQAWFSLEYEAFPGSLLVRLQFADEAALQSAQAQLQPWQLQLSKELLKRGIVLKDMRKHLVMTCQSPDD